MINTTLYENLKSSYSQSKIRKVGIMQIVTASNRGQIVIPKSVRKQLHIGPGKKLLIKAGEDRITLFPLPDDPVNHFCGFFGGKPSLTKALLTERKKERHREEKTLDG